ncbi:hypothetical protein KDA11_01755 [Candidatus Saccharibacteria bacterium]|nr:hypothetical protein [Candidatus Saccharibacteria bacterium]
MKKSSPSAAFVPACLLIGMGVGFLTGAFLAGLFIGLGSGILLMTVYEIKTKSNK